MATPDGLYPKNKYEESGTFTYVDAGAEQTILELTGDVPRLVKGILLDLVNITLDGTIIVYTKIDKTNYRELERFPFTVASDPDGVYINREYPIVSDFKVTYTESGDEGSDRDIPYALIYE